ncbi:integral membrane [Fusarium sporotrichioides]|uniref:Integral membrane n=1 Tax=Fusarium sporotrichioides TaxID=5514 RepID=A0A395SPS8_FUSSP|nr:integral membrane [Fusarium sporotrichioides]
MNITAEQAARSHETKSDLMLGVSVVLMAVGSVLVAVRLWCRRLIHSTGRDDISAVLALAFLIASGTSIAAMTRYGLGRHDWTLSLDQTVLFGRYLRIMNVSRMRWVYIGSMIYLSIWALLQVVGLLLSCIPLEAFWDPRIKGKCFKHQTLMCLEVETPPVAEVVAFWRLWTWFLYHRDFHPSSAMAHARERLHVVERDSSIMVSSGTCLGYRMFLSPDLQTPPQQSQELDPSSQKWREYT